MTKGADIMDRAEIERKMAEARELMNDAIWPSERIEHAFEIAKLEQQLKELEAED